MNKAFIDRFFRSVDCCVWDLMSGKIGFKTKEGIITIELNDLNDDKTEAVDAQVSVNPFDDFGMEIPAFAQSVPVDSINLGDMIFSSSTNKVLGWVVKKNEKSFKLMKEDGTRSDWVPPKVNMLGFDSGVMVLRSLMNMLPGGSTGLSSMQASLMPMMAMGMLGEGSTGLDLKGMMPIMLMSQMGLGTADATSANPMANMMPMLMMMQMMGGKSPGMGKSSTNFFDR
jgi:hypothetical protein